MLRSNPVVGTHCKHKQFRRIVCARGSNDCVLKVGAIRERFHGVTSIPEVNEQAITIKSNARGENHWIKVLTDTKRGAGRRLLMCFELAMRVGGIEIGRGIRSRDADGVREGVSLRPLTSRTQRS